MRAASLGLFICFMFVPCYGRYWKLPCPMVTSRVPLPHVTALDLPSLCASNSVTYKTYCEFLYAKSHYPDLEVLHSGACKPVDFEDNHPWYSDNEYKPVVKPTKRPRKHPRMKKVKHVVDSVTDEKVTEEEVTKEEVTDEVVTGEQVTDEEVTEEEDKHPSKGSNYKYYDTHNINNEAINKNIVIIKKKLGLQKRKLSVPRNKYKLSVKTSKRPSKHPRIKKQKKGKYLPEPVSVTKEKVTEEEVTKEKVTDEQVTKEWVTSEKVTEEEVTEEEVTDEEVTEEEDKHPGKGSKYKYYDINKNKNVVLIKKRLGLQKQRLLVPHKEYKLVIQPVKRPRKHPTTKKLKKWKYLELQPGSVTKEKVTEEEVTQEKVTEEEVTKENVTREKVTKEEVTNEKVTEEEVTKEEVAG